MSNKSFPGYGSILNEFLKTFRKIPDEESSKLRPVRCPNCGFRLMDVVGYDHMIIKTKCSRCKFEEAIDVALYRRIKRYKNEAVYRHPVR